MIYIGHLARHMGELPIIIIIFCFFCHLARHMGELPLTHIYVHI
jgi:hypothetical protein